ncbi:MAG: hypothetical protein H0U12_10920 [Thermoleophilaceae bacterium]|nr:hypothetical protein [Thermoleophilaceae bacterium]
MTNATQAVEMDQDPPNAPAPEAPICGSGQSPVDALLEGFEGSPTGWSTSGAWAPIDVYAKTGRGSMDAPAVGFAADYSAVSPPVTIPSGGQLHFDHSYGFEDYPAEDYPAFNFDGGRVEYSTNGTSWNDAGPLFTHNGYDGQFGDSGSGTNGFVADSYGYRSSRADLSSLAGQSVRLRFRITTDDSVGDFGWTLDNVRVYSCVDTTEPTAVAPSSELSTGSTFGTSATGASVPTRISWAAGSDNVTPSGSLTYRLEERVNSGAWTPVTGFSTARSAQRMQAPGRRYEYRVIARDGAGNVSTPATGLGLRVDARQESSSLVSYSSGWLSRLARRSAWGAKVRPTTRTGAKARSSFTGRSVAVVMPKARNLGTAKVCLLRGAARRACTTVDQSPRSGLGQRKAVFTRNGLSPTQPHRVEVSDVSGRVELDGVVVLK